jgi:(p)ppGpp synthase/HD superfamily hydrolase
MPALAELDSADLDRRAKNRFKALEGNLFMLSLGKTKEPTTLLLAALKFAAHKHSRQRRKDLEATPYITHLIDVAEVLSRIGGITDLPTLQAAILHDTIEDTETSPQELEDYFGQEVRLLVQEVTDDKSLPKQERKRLQVEHAATLSTRAKLIKLGDKICNVSEITPTEPAEWPLQRKLEYFDWAEKVVAGCRGSNLDLEQHFDAVLRKSRETLV